MFAKKFKKKCSVRGCKNTDNVFVISKRREMSNTIALCRECMKEALAVTENYVEPEKVKFVDKPLFPHPELKVTLSSVADEEPELNEVIVESNVTEENPISVAEDTVTLQKEEEKTATKPKSTTNNSNTKKSNNTKRK